ncbi:MarR family transcriptional regulator [Heyndrickxia coagulans]|uniref:MarR family winged helix-turn-helix transcriptional regulator n=1 Tax=Heyndrickxia TaxID=2837504 RepID=UPI00048C977D|nr:MarR family transcriptional regulator [Heyndrickxia coagulans]MED4346326.1 MarR family transcriptional regulator [Heyndrickxia coagulans]MED4406310.1 MarR family transcriptional regulator [Heyndrickxia coagulans]MED4935878.1 MarR family transcriptional regulator [Heyndrickxia coagulans]MED4966464.1 MarR family transcriptional regulator [Heyndrickxia coagulans]NCG69142.1 MarR family transcriptional regulator [Heyndrickxia coagulans]
MGVLETKDTVDLEFIFRRVYRKIKEELHSLLKEHVTLNEFMVLKLLSESPMRSSDLSKMLQVSASHITSVTDSLVEKGLIERRRSNKDRRVVDLILTEKGKSLIGRLKEIKSRFLKDQLDVFTEEERETLYKLFRKFEDHLNQMH